ncbi:MAG TPA: exodeoxyribonuclease VII large subunit [Bacillota bacterium]
MEPKYISVSQLTYALKRLIEENFPLDGVWIQGEISNFTAHSSGHLYFTLKDETACLKCVLFKSQARGLSFRPGDGMAVSVRGRIAVYEKAGQYQLYVDTMEPAGMGDLYQRFECLKARLAAEGLFDPGRKRPLPSLPQRVGLITSPTGAAVQDMIKILRRRRPNLDILLIPARVQGEDAPASLVKALDEAARFEALDLVIIGRGGGSLEELWAFNDERVARAIADFPKPIISAVGHETDFTIADFVADLRAPTPSAAAELAVPDQTAMERHIVSMADRLKQAMSRGIQSKRRDILNLLRTKALRFPKYGLDLRRQELDLISERMSRRIRQDLLIKRERYCKTLGKLDTLSPLATFKRGYSLAQKPDGSFIRRSDQVEIGERLRLTLAVGKIDCQVLDKEV